MNYTYRICLCILSFCGVYSATAQPYVCMTHNVANNTLVFDTSAFNQFINLTAYDGIFYGEQHNASFDPILKYQLITTLNNTQGIRDVFMEIGHAAAWCYNMYLETGDTTYIYSRRLVYTKDGYRQFWRDLYTYNSSLPANKKLVVHGVDFERTEAFMALKRLAVNEPPAELMAFADTIAAHTNDLPLEMYNENKEPITLFRHNMKKLRESFIAHEAAAKTYFGSNYAVAKSILLNEGIPSPSLLPRNKTMYAELTRQLPGYPVKFMFFMGRTHASLFIKSSIPNLALKDKLKAVTVNEVIYDLPSSMTDPEKARSIGNLMPADKNCKAVLMRATDVPQCKNEADFVIISSK
ncbi:MAG: hypothetical protein EOP51_08525 [Sphingobacteriales bacterium]|nr:MAG: hypothetical protein EOP51_08525 [Sphingobacteriales bacterium]